MGNITITLADGRKIFGLGKNGSNYVSAVRIDESVFENNLSVMTVSDGENDEIFTDMVFSRQMELDGMFCLTFRQRTQQEKMLGILSEHTSELTDMQMALAEIYEMILGGM